MRADNVPESEMNKLFQTRQDAIDVLFSKSEYRSAIGVFEGANYRSTGYYRSEQNCLMFTRTTRFCQVCSDAIEQVIDEYSRGAFP